MVALTSVTPMTRKNSEPRTFGVVQKEGPRPEPSWFYDRRQAAFQRFSELGFPTARQEAWKYTNLGALAQTTFQSAPAHPNAQISKRDSSKLQAFEIDSYRMVLIHGVFSESLSALEALPPGAIVMGLRKALNTHAALVREHLARYVQDAQNAFAALNTAHFQDGVFVWLEEDIVLPKPIQLVFLSTASDVPLISQPRNLIVLGRRARAALIEHHGSLDGGTYLANGITEIALGEGASLDHMKLERESPRAFHMATTQVSQGSDSVFSSFVLDLGGKLVRNHLNVTLNGPGAQSHLLGLYLTEGEQQVNHYTLIDHPKPHGLSRQLYKGILGGASQGVFSGRIFVHQDAQQTDAAQTNKNLLLSEGATVHTKPHLEIFADDVKCTHGAAVGQLDENAIFYLKSRGLDETVARKILLYGFASDIIERISIPALRGTLNQLVLAKLEHLDEGGR